MSMRVGGMRQPPIAVRHLNKCQNPNCDNKVLTRLQDYVKCNRCGWDSKMTREDVERKFGGSPKVALAPEAAPQLAEVKSEGPDVVKCPAGCVAGNLGDNPCFTCGGSGYVKANANKTDDNGLLARHPDAAAEEDLAEETVVDQELADELA